VSSTPSTNSNENTKEEEYYKYVPHHQQKIWEELGWSFHAYLGPPHAAYSSLYKWMGSGLPVVPNTQIEINKKIDMEIKDDESNGE
jgi:hypothetical protein